MKKLLLFSVLLSFLILPAFAGGEKEADSGMGKEKVVLTLWQNVWGANEQAKLPQEQWYITKAIKRFQDSKPNVEIDIEMTVPPDQQAAHQTYKAASLANNAPDIFNMWSGTMVFEMEDLVLPLDDLIPSEDKQNIIGWETVQPGFDPDAKILGYPVGGVDLAYFYYNKKLIKNAGLDFENNPPRTRAEFDEALEKIKASGVIPIVCDESNFNAGHLNVFAAFYWYLQTAGRDRIISNSWGETKFANDKAFMDYLEYYQSLYARGYVNQDCATSTNSLERFLAEEGAIIPTGNWYLENIKTVLGEDTGIIRPPEFTSGTEITNGMLGGPGQCAVVSKGCEHPELAVDFISFLSSKDEIIRFQKVAQRFPLRTDVTPAELGYEGKPLYSKLSEFAKDYVYWVDNSINPAVNSEITRLMSLVLTGKMTPSELAEALDRVASE